MWNLLWAVLSSAGVSLVMRLSVDRVKNQTTMLAAGYASCTALALLHTAARPMVLPAQGQASTLVLGILAGVLLLAGFLFLQYNVRVNGVVLSGVFAKLGVLVPTVVSVLFFRERPGLAQIAGFALAITAILLIHCEKTGAQAASKTALLLLLLTNGAADAMSKIFEQAGHPAWQEIYLLLSFFTAFCLCVLLAVLHKEKITRADAGFGLLVGIPNYYCARFLIQALTTVPAAVAYPTYSVATIVVITAAGMLLFREKISRRQKIAMGIIGGALVLLHL